MASARHIHRTAFSAWTCTASPCDADEILARGDSFFLSVIPLAVLSAIGFVVYLILMHQHTISDMHA